MLIHVFFVVLLWHAGLPEYWFERQGKIQKRIEGVQGKNEA